MLSNDFTLKLVAIILTFFVIIVALLSPIRIHALSPSHDTSPYSLDCNYATNVPIPTIFKNTRDLTGVTAPSWWSDDNGWKSEKLQAVVFRPAGQTYYTLAVLDGSRAELRIFNNSDPRAHVAATITDTGSSLGGGVLRWYNIAYSGSTTSGWQQTSAATQTWTSVEEICGYTDGVVIDRSQTNTTLASATWRKYFPWNDGNTFKYGSQWHFMETPTTEPVGTTSSGDSLNQTELEETLVKLLGISLALLVGAGVVLAFRYR